MDKAITFFVGLDVHKETIAVATLHPGSTLCEEQVIPNTPEAVRTLGAAWATLHSCGPATKRAPPDMTPTGCFLRWARAARSSPSWWTG